MTAARSNGRKPNCEVDNLTNRTADKPDNRKWRSQSTQEFFCTLLEGRPASGPEWPDLLAELIAKHGGRYLLVAKGNAIFEALPDDLRDILRHYCRVSRDYGIFIRIPKAGPTAAMRARWTERERAFELYLMAKAQHPELCVGPTLWCFVREIIVKDRLARGWDAGEAEKLTPNGARYLVEQWKAGQKRLAAIEARMARLWIA